MMIFDEFLINEESSDQDLLAGYPPGTFFIRPSQNQQSQDNVFTLVFVNYQLNLTRYKLSIQNDGSIQLLKSNNETLDFNVDGVNIAPANFDSKEKFIKYAKEQGLSSKNSIVKLTDPLVELKKMSMTSKLI